MSMQQDPIASAFQNYSAPAVSPCPSPEEIWAAVTLECSPEKRREIIAHVAKCPACAEDWRVAQSFPKDLPAEFGAIPPVELQAANEAPPPRNNVVSLHKWKRVAAPLAAVAAVLALIYIPWRANNSNSGLELPKPGGDPVYRKADTGAAPLKQSFDPAQGFRWAPSKDPGAVYEVSIFDNDFRPVHTVSGIRTPELKLSPELRTLLPAGEFSWQVTTKQANGRQTRSALQHELHSK